MSDLLASYLKINFLLWVGLILLKLIVVSSKNYLQFASKKKTLSLARITFAVSLLGLFIVPTYEATMSIPTVSIDGFRAIGEGTLNNNLTNGLQDIEATKPDSVVAASLGISHSIWFLVQIICLMGILIFAIRFGIAIFNLHRLLLNSSIYRCTKKSRIYLSEHIKIPISFFYFGKGVVVLPLDLVQNQMHMRIALAHEHHHIRQCDIHWAYVLEFLKMLFWWNPAIFKWSRELEYLSELSCDEQVLLRKRSAIKVIEYAQCLISFAEKAIALPPTRALMSAMTSRKARATTLSRRIDMLTNRIYQNKRIGIVAVRGVAIFILLICSTLAIQVRATKTDQQVHPKFQRIVNSALLEGLQRAGAQSGFAILADVVNGQILAVSRQESADEGYISTSSSEFLDHAFEPFSLIKPIVAAIVLDKSKLTEQTILDARGGQIKFGNRNFYDWKDHGQITVADSIANSSFIGSIRIAQKLEEGELIDGIKKFGVNPGQIHLLTGKEAVFNLPNIANGTGVLFLTVKDILRAYSVIANGGELKELSGYDINQNDSKTNGRVISENTALRIKRILLRTMETGTGRWAQSSKYTIAGKTGTGYVTNPKPDEKYQKGERGEFVGFAPYENPRLISLVIVDRPKGPAHGSAHAAPVVRTILNRSLAELNIEGDRAASAD